jgi:hypothetical protein
MLDWWRKKSSAQAVRRREIRVDAEVLRVLFGDGAYYEARRRSRDDTSPEAKHWRAVAVVIAQRSERKVGLDTATLMARPEE